MTRARAIELLKGIQFCCDFDDCTNAWDCDECVDAFNMAIEALEHEPTAEYSSDVISRQDAIDTVMGFMPSLTTPDGCGQFDREIFEAQEMFVDIGQALNKLPSAQPEIIRCKECKHNLNTCFNHGVNEPICEFTDRKMKETGFCSFGERRA